MSLNAIRFFAVGKKLKRVLRHRKKYLAAIKHPNETYTPPTQHDITDFVAEAASLGLYDLAQIGRMAHESFEVNKQRIEYKQAYSESVADMIRLNKRIAELQAHVARLEEKLRRRKRERNLRETKRR